MAELTADERIEKIAVECLELLESRLKNKSSHSRNIESPVGCFGALQGDR
jgi:hypothetical protein